jgi:hypothetical protein
MPIMGVCLSCSGPLQPSVTRGSVEKYLQLGLRLSQKYDVGEYLRSRFVLASEELATLFKPEGHQSDINDYFAITSELKATVTISQSNAIAQPPIIQVAEIMGTSKESMVASEELDEAHRSGKKKKPNNVEQFQTTLF